MDVPMVGLTSQLTTETRGRWYQTLTTRESPGSVKRWRPQGPTPTKPHTFSETLGAWESAFWILSIPPHACGAWLYSARYRTAPGWTGTGGVEFKPHLCLLLFLPLSFHLDDWDNTTWVNTVTDMTLSQDAGTSGSGFQKWSTFSPKP